MQRKLQMQELPLIPVVPSPLIANAAKFKIETIDRLQKQNRRFLKTASLLKI